jgi:hypothetical protein
MYWQALIQSLKVSLFAVTLFSQQMPLPGHCGIKSGMSHANSIL